MMGGELCGCSNNSSCSCRFGVEVEGELVKESMVEVGEFCRWLNNDEDSLKVEIANLLLALKTFQFPDQEEEEDQCSTYS